MFKLVPFDTESNCSICEKTEICFDGRGFYGVNEIECICEECLANGRLEDLEIFTNDVYSGSDEQRNEIAFRTPKLPTWQDVEWPFVDGDYCVFEKLASKEDFDNVDDFRKSILKADLESMDVDLVWSSMPNKKILNLSDGNHSLTIYLFSSSGKKICIWDAL